MSHNTTLSYLRGLAIFLVFGYHAALTGFSGGYIGVDIFFLISGYLIASKVVNIASPKDIKEFYVKRIKKIYPSLVAVLVITVYTFWWLDGWTENTTRYMQEAFTAMLGIVNVGFASYASAEAYTTSPFLHLWSVAIEIQFYIIAPLLAYLIYKNPRVNARRTLSVLGIISLISFFAASYFDVLFAYYSSFGRIWEFALGAGIYLYSVKRQKPVMVENNLKLLLTIATLTIFLYSILFAYLPIENPVYGVLAILSAGVIIYVSDLPQLFTEKNNFVKITLFKPLEFLSLISYPLYLIHYPVLFFTFTYYPEFIWTGIIFSVLAAYVLTTTIEQPILRMRSKHTDIK